MILGGFLRERRAAWPWFDHLARAGSHYKRVGGDRLAAALTMYALFALLPLLLVAMSVLGYVLARDPERQRQVFESISNALPGVGVLLGRALTAVRTNRATTGAFGLVGLLFSGLGGVDALRDALRVTWGHTGNALGFVKRKAADLVTLAVVGALLVVSFVVSALATGGAGALLTRAGTDAGVAHWVVEALSFALGVAVDATLLLVLFTWLPRTGRSWRTFVRGAVFGGVAFGVLKLVAGWYVGRTAARSTALYGSIGTAVAILVGLYLVSRVVLFTAAWTATAPSWEEGDPSRATPRRTLAESRP